MAETATTSGRPDDAVRATRRAAARMRSAVASDEPPYFWTVSCANSGDDMGSVIGQRQTQRGAWHLEPRSRRIEGSGNRVQLRPGSAQGQDRRAGARDVGTKRTCLHGCVQKRSALGKQREAERLVE